MPSVHEPEAEGGPFGGVRLKLAQAARHIGVLQEAVTEYRSRDPFGTDQTYDELEGGARTYRLTATVREQPPLEWGVVIGDVVHKLRSALDHAVFAVADPGSRNDRRSQFPICDTESDFTSKVPTQLSGVSARRVDLIRGEQPFLWPWPNRSWHALRVLRELSDIDKHRMVHTVALAPDGEFAGVTNVVIPGFELPGRAAPIRDGDVVMEFTAEPEDPDLPMQVQAQTSYQVAIEGQTGATAMIETLTLIHSRIEYYVVNPLEDPDRHWFLPIPTDAGSAG